MPTRPEPQPTAPDLALGVIADDFTGAGDAASFLAAGGAHVVLLNGLARDVALPPDVDVVVVALKSRTQKTAEAVGESRAALELLRSLGAHQIYDKYCSTFDSTDAGNIGPIADMLVEQTHTPWTILCPALPANGRTTHEGVLYVDGVPLARSPMRLHPLTPMTRSWIPDLMAPQSAYPTYVLPRAVYA
ncbi:four-carbon acid sugar kinase family protein, partial [Actinomyces sp. MRS3W]|uniref:four-carbon acid sugar kinase family protein n=1 Tax=Actinomyces sp. MRS3W TaxID=2800796 RepID=UPI0028FD95D3